MCEENMKNTTPDLSNGKGDWTRRPYKFFFGSCLSESDSKKLCTVLLAYGPFEWWDCILLAIKKHIICLKPIHKFNYLKKDTSINHYLGAF